jgi:hypothetical protein
METQGPLKYDSDENAQVEHQARLLTTVRGIVPQHVDPGHRVGVDLAAVLAVAHRNLDEARGDDGIRMELFVRTGLVRHVIWQVTEHEYPFLDGLM